METKLIVAPESAQGLPAGYKPFVGCYVKETEKHRTKVAEGPEYRWTEKLTCTLPQDAKSLVVELVNEGAGVLGGCNVDLSEVRASKQDQRPVGLYSPQGQHICNLLLHLELQAPAHAQQSANASQPSYQETTYSQQASYSSLGPATPIAANYGQGPPPPYNPEQLGKMSDEDAKKANMMKYGKIGAGLVAGAAAVGLASWGVHEYREHEEEKREEEKHHLEEEENRRLREERERERRRHEESEQREKPYQQRYQNEQPHHYEADRPTQRVSHQRATLDQVNQNQSNSTKKQGELAPTQQYNMDTQGETGPEQSPILAQTHKKRKRSDELDFNMMRSIKKKDKKKILTASKHDQTFEIKDGVVILHPKISLKNIDAFIPTSEIRSLILACVSDKVASPRHVDILQREKIKKVVVLAAPVIDPVELDIPPETRVITRETVPALFENAENMGLLRCLGKHTGAHSIAKVFCNKFDTSQGVHDQFLNLLKCPTNKNLRMVDAKSYKVMEKRRKTNVIEKSIQPESLLLTLADMIDNNYPIPTALDPNVVIPQGWVESRTGIDMKPTRMAALDCEMCQTTGGLAVTRVALVDQMNHVLINEFVKPDDDITDYLTPFSGVSAKDLEGVKTTLRDIQAKIQEHVTADVILVGHGLENDLNALRLCHPHIIDTSVVYHHMHGPPYKPSLQYLAHTWLHRAIQNANTTEIVGSNTTQRSGHDPTEDAIASLDLVKQKIENGLDYGLHHSSRYETLLQLLERYQLRGSVVMAEQKRDSLLSLKLSTHSESYVKVQSDAALAERVIERHRDNHVVLAKMDPLSLDNKDRTATVRYVQQIYDTLEPSTAFILLSQSPADEQLERLRHKKSQFDQRSKRTSTENIPESELWTQELSEEMHTLSLRHCRGFLFANVKNEA